MKIDLYNKNFISTWIADNEIYKERIVDEDYLNHLHDEFSDSELEWIINSYALQLFISDYFGIEYDLVPEYVDESDLDEFLMQY